MTPRQYRPEDEDLRKEAWGIFGTVALELERVSEAGSLPRNLAAATADEMNFLGIAREHEVPVVSLAGLARDVVALHARVLVTLRERELSGDSR